MPDKLLRRPMVGEHLAIEAMTRGTVRRTKPCAWRQLSRGGADDGSPAVMDGDVEAEIGAIHDHTPPAAAAAANGSTSL
jgi:hypothetical protein